MAIDESWYTSLKAVLHTHFKTRVRSILGEQYPKLYFTVEEDNMEDTKFPAVLFDELPPAERGMTLDATSVNGVWETIQVTVYSQDRYDTKVIMDACVQAMKQLRFSITAFPIYETNHDVKYGVARFRRIIGAGDSF